MKRFLVLGCALFALLVVLVLGYASKGIVSEYWEIWRLGSKDEASRLSAAKRLGESRSLRAAPYVVRAIGEEKREKASCWKGEGYRSKYSFTPLSYALYQIGPSALPVLERFTGIEKRKKAAISLFHTEESPLPGIKWCLELAWQSPLSDVVEEPYPILADR